MSRYVSSDCKSRYIQRHGKRCFYCARQVDEYKDEEFHYDRMEWGQRRMFPSGRIAEDVIICGACRRFEPSEFEESGDAQCQGLTMGGEQCTFKVKKGSRRFCKIHDITYSPCLRLGRGLSG